MMPFLCRRSVAAVLVVVSAAAISASSQAQPFQWWRSEQFKSELGLTADQAARIDSIFQSTTPELREDWRELDQLEDKLSRLIETNADEARVSRQLDRVEDARATLNKTRTLMLFRIRQVLTEDQRVRLKALQKQWERDRRDGSNPRAGRPAPTERGSGSPKR